MGVDIDGIKKLKTEQANRESLTPDEIKKFNSKEFVELVRISCSFNFHIILVLF